MNRIRPIEPLPAAILTYSAYIQAFFQENGLWYQLNATGKRIRMETVPENRRALIVIGSSLNEDAISVLLTGKLPENHIL